MKTTSKIIIATPGYSDTVVRIYDTTEKITITRGAAIIYEGPADTLIRRLQFMRDFVHNNKVDKEYKDWRH